MSTLDNPSQSLFQGPDININNSQNNEEDEDQEDQIRRKEELQNLLHEALDDFKFDDSTINSSTNVSIASLDDVQKNYRDVMPSEQLKVLYEVKVRELNNLRNEFDNFKAEKKKEHDNLKNKLLLFEADIRQLQASNKNSESLLAEKIDTINSYKKTISVKDAELKTLKEIIEDYKIEVCTYKTTINELQMKIAENNPFKMGAKAFESEELRKAHEDQIFRLESVIEEESKKTEQLQRENKTLKEDLNRLVQLRDEMETEFKTQMNQMIGNLDGANAQCKDLVNVVEHLTKENEHLKDRLQSHENKIPILSEETFDRKSMDYDTLLVQLERLKRLLLDQTMEINTNKAKLKFYESDVQELVEYREIKSEMCKKQHRKCDQSLHIQDLLVMQNELKNLSKTLADKDNQIANITAINRELQGKIEEMLRETRTEILNLSHKYNMPQLEALTEELKLAEEKVLDLQKELQQVKEQNMHELKMQIKEKDLAYSELQEDNKALKEEVRALNENMKEQLRDFISNLQKASSGSQIDNPKVLLLIKTEIEEVLAILKDGEVEKQLIEEKLSAWKKQLDFVKFVRKSVSQNDNEMYRITLTKLEEEHAKVRKLEETIQELASAKTLLEAEKYAVDFQLKDYETQVSPLKRENAKLTETLNNFMQKNIEENHGELENLKLQIKQKDQLIEGYNRDKERMVEILEALKRDLTESKKEIFRLEKELSDSQENHIKRNLREELERAENLVEQSRIQDDTEIMETEHFKKSLQAEVLKIELNLHEKYQKEFAGKLGEIEKKYLESMKVYKAELEKAKGQETLIRKEFAKIFGECGQKMLEMEVEKNNYFEELKQLNQEYMDLKARVAKRESEYRIVVQGIYNDAKELDQRWRKWVSDFVDKWTKLENCNRKARDKVLANIEEAEVQIKKIEKKTEARKVKLTATHL